MNHRMTDSVPDSSLHSLQTVKTMHRGRPGKDPKQHHPAEAGRYSSYSQPTSAQSPQRQTPNRLLLWSCPSADYEKTPNAWSSTGDNFTQTGTLCMSTFVFLCSTVVSWRKKVVLWGGGGKASTSQFCCGLLCVRASFPHPCGGHS